ncbi:hypothetical protein OG900_32990 [Streptomyces sp. NBC_00433]
MTYTVREFLDADLDRLRRASNLEALTARFTGQPLPETVANLRAALVDGIGMEDFRRLHILISHLYHHCGAGFQLTADLFAEVGQALARTTITPERGGTHVLSD